MKIVDEHIKITIDVSINHILFHILTKKDIAFAMEYTFNGHTDSFKEKFSLNCSCLEMKTTKSTIKYDKKRLQEKGELLEKNLEMINMIKKYIDVSYYCASRSKDNKIKEIKK